jgi:hypothetical protein
MTMPKTMPRRFLAISCLYLCLTAAAPAVLLAQLVVYDPVNHIQALARYAELILTYEQLVAEYKHLVNQAKIVPVNMLARYRAPEVRWRHASAPDTYGTTAGWIAGLNVGDTLGAGYRAATERLQEYNTALATLSPATAAEARRAYATVELSDGATIAAIHGIGAIRSTARDVERVITALEADAFATDASMQSQVAILNKINGTTVLALRDQQSTNQLLTHLLEAQLVAAKRSRDAEVVDINGRIARRSREADFDRTTRAGTTDAIQTFRVRVP